jgi:hypothetical protein
MAIQRVIIHLMIPPRRASTCNARSVRMSLNSSIIFIFIMYALFLKKQKKKESEKIMRKSI